MNVASSFGIAALISAGIVVGCGGTTSLGSSSSRDAGGNAGSSALGGGALSSRATDYATVSMQP
jgi:hypothetical protein